MSNYLIDSMKLGIKEILKLISEEERLKVKKNKLDKQIRILKLKKEIQQLENQVKQKADSLLGASQT